LHLITHHVMKTYGGTDVYPHTFLTSVLDGVSGSFMAQLLYPKEGPHDTHWICGWVGSKAATDATEKRKMSCPLSGTEP
jgi:hypothetical protein